MSAPRRGLVVVRGAGDLATGTIVRLTRAGFLVAALEAERPTAIRRTVAFSEAVYEGSATVEGLEARRVGGAGEALDLVARGVVPVLVDPSCASLEELAPEALVDAVIAKRNLGTGPCMASVVVALGPGFSAPRDARAVIETNRGHDLGRVILEGSAQPDTGTPGIIAGAGPERVVHAAAEGRIEALREIGDIVSAGDPILAIVGPAGKGREIMRSPLDGVLRGLIRPGLLVPRGLKVADVDPRGRREHCFSISDKARAISGGVLEALMLLGSRPS